MRVIRNNWKYILVLILLIIGIYTLNYWIIRQRAGLGDHDEDESYLTPKKAISSAFREVRVTMADILWIKVDAYFHSALTPEEHERIHPGHPEHLSGLVSHHQPRENSEFMPLIRLVTDLDPQFIEAYRTGAWWMWSRLNQVKPAIEFLQEGIQNNPTRFELSYDLGLLYFNKLNDYPKAAQQFQFASRIPMDERDKSTVMEYLAFSYERMNQNQEAFETWKKVANLNIPPYAIAARDRIKEYTFKRGAQQKI